MSSLPRRCRTVQEPPQAKAFRLATQVTPMQRHLVARVGLSRWLHLPVPRQPCAGRQTAAARALAAGEFGLLEPSPNLIGGYQLTARAELVAGMWLLTALMSAVAAAEVPAASSPVPFRS